jgi:hypothetical protein
MERVEGGDTQNLLGFDFKLNVVELEKSLMRIKSVEAFLGSKTLP